MLFEYDCLAGSELTNRIPQLKALTLESLTHEGQGRPRIVE